MTAICLPPRSLGEGGLVNRIDNILAGKHRKPFCWRFFVLAHQSATINGQIDDDNDEARMANDEGMTKTEFPNAGDGVLAGTFCCEMKGR